MDASLEEYDQNREELHKTVHNKKCISNGVDTNSKPETATDNTKPHNTKEAGDCQDNLGIDTHNTVVATGPTMLQKSTPTEGEDKLVRNNEESAQCLVNEDEVKKTAANSSSSKVEDLLKIENDNILLDSKSPNIANAKSNECSELMKLNEQPFDGQSEKGVKRKNSDSNEVSQKSKLDESTENIISQNTESGKIEVKNCVTMPSKKARRSSSEDETSQEEKMSARTSSDKESDEEPLIVTDKTTGVKAEDDVRRDQLNDDNHNMTEENSSSKVPFRRRAESSDLADDEPEDEATTAEENDEELSEDEEEVDLDDNATEDEAETDGENDTYSDENEDASDDEIDDGAVMDIEKLNQQIHDACQETDQKEWQDTEAREMDEEDLKDSTFQDKNENEDTNDFDDIDGVVDNTSNDVGSTSSVDIALQNIQDESNEKSSFTNNDSNIDLDQTIVGNSTLDEGRMEDDACLTEEDEQKETNNATTAMEIIESSKNVCNESQLHNNDVTLTPSEPDPIVDDLQLGNGNNKKLDIESVSFKKDNTVAPITDNNDLEQMEFEMIGGHCSKSHDGDMMDRKKSIETGCRTDADETKTVVPTTTSELRNDDNKEDCINERENEIKITSDKEENVVGKCQEISVSTNENIKIIQTEPSNDQSFIEKKTEDNQNDEKELTEKEDGEKTDTCDEDKTESATDAATDLDEESDKRVPHSIGRLKERPKCTSRDVVDAQQPDNSSVAPAPTSSPYRSSRRGKRGLERELQQLDYWGRRTDGNTHNTSNSSKRRRRTGHDGITAAHLLRSFVPAALLG